MRGGVEQKKEQKKEGLLEAAYQLFLEKGVNKTSVDEIVKKANVAKGTFYLYFHDKTQLLQQLTYRDLSRTFEEADRARLRALQVVSPDERADWLVDFWCRKNVRGLIQMPFSRHWIMHVEASLRIRNKIHKEAAI